MSSRLQRAVPFSDVAVGNSINSNEVVDSNTTDNNEDNNIPVDEEAGNIVNSEQNNIM